MPWPRRSRRWADARCASRATCWTGVRIQRLHDAVIATFGKVDILVNGAGMTKKMPTLEADEADWSKIVETNLTGTYARLPDFRPHHGERALWAHH